MPHETEISACVSCDFGLLLSCKEPVASLDDLDGLRIRSTRDFNLADHGAVIVAIPGGEIASALERGVIDCVAYPAGFQ